MRKIIKFKNVKIIWDIIMIIMGIIITTTIWGGR